MTDKALTVTTYNPIAAQIDRSTSRKTKDIRVRLTRFLAWQESRGETWYMPDLEAWRDGLVAEGKAPGTVSAYLATVRGAYRRVLRDNAARQHLYNMAPPDASPADKKAFVDELLTRIQNAVHPDTAPVKQVVRQDTADSEFLRLTKQQAERLLNAPDVNTLPGLRDAAIIAVLLCTGLREDELCQLLVDDLRQEMGGVLALLVRHGKGDKQRLIPYGGMDWCLVLVDVWLQSARIAEGPVFRGFYKGNRIVRETPITPRAVQHILARYPIVINGRLVRIKPHDCRRTYARLQFENGMDLVAIQQNLGHVVIETTLGYIGTLDADRRMSKGALDYDLGKLPR
nr:tyrosine-type recombinase/integrase [Anaerolineae bacterium]